MTGIYRTKITENRELFKQHNVFALNLIEPGSTINTIKVNEYHVLPIVKEHCTDKNLKSIVIPESLIEETKQYQQIDESLNLIQSQVNTKLYEKAVHMFKQRKNLLENEQQIDPKDYFKNKGQVNEQEEEEEQSSDSRKIGKFELTQDEIDLTNIIIENYIDIDEDQLEGLDKTIHPSDVPEQNKDEGGQREEYISDGEYLLNFKLPIDSYRFTEQAEEYDVDFAIGFEAKIDVTEGETPSGGPEPGSIEVSECTITNFNMHAYPKGESESPYIEIEEATEQEFIDNVQNGEKMIKIIKDNISEFYSS